MKMTNHFPLILENWDGNDVKDEHCAPLWKFKSLKQTLNNKMQTPNGMETKDEINIMEVVMMP